MANTNATCELGKFVPQLDGFEAVEFLDLASQPVTLRGGARTVTLLPRFNGPVRLSAEQARALATVLQRWVLRRTFAKPEEHNAAG